MKSSSVYSSDDESCRHPRRAADLFGHTEAERTLLDAYNSNRLAHAWMLCGPKGIGKATLAYRFARFLLAQSDGAKETGLFASDLPITKTNSLFVDSKAPVFGRVAAGSHADLMSIERKYDEKKGKFKNEIIVDDIRRIANFFSLSAAEGGWRVIIIDSADELNSNAANALLKVLEEPPTSAILLLISHNYRCLLPTIRSRCRKLVLSTLTEDAVTELLLKNHPEMLLSDASFLAHLSDGSIGRALDLEEEGGLQLYRDIFSLLDTLPNLNVVALHTLAGKLGRVGGDNAFHTFCDLILGWLGRFILFATKGKKGVDTKETHLYERLLYVTPLASWLEVWDKISNLLSRTDPINMDRRQIIISIFLLLEKTVQV